MKISCILYAQIGRAPGRKMLKSITAGAALLIASFLSPQAQAQTNATIKTFRIHFEVPEGFIGTNFYTINPGFSTNFTTLRIPTNNLPLDIDGVHWDVGPVTVGIFRCARRCRGVFDGYVE